MDITLRPADDSDIDFLLSLRDKTMRSHLEAVGMPTSREAYVQRVWYKFDDAQIIELDGVSIGLFKATYDAERNYWYLIQIQVAPEYQGQKIGSRLISDLIAKARCTGATLGLSVIHNNPAKKLYTALGFNVVHDSGVEHLMEISC